MLGPPKSTETNPVFPHQPFNFFPGVVPDNSGLVSGMDLSLPKLLVSSSASGGSATGDGHSMQRQSMDSAMAAITASHDVDSVEAKENLSAGTTPLDSSSLTLLQPPSVDSSTANGNSMQQMAATTTTTTATSLMDTGTAMQLQPTAVAIADEFMASSSSMSSTGGGFSLSLFPGASSIGQQQVAAETEADSGLFDIADTSVSHNVISAPTAEATAIGGAKSGGMQLPLPSNPSANATAVPQPTAAIGVGHMQYAQPPFQFQSDPIWTLAPLQGAPFQPHGAIPMAAPSIGNFFQPHPGVPAMMDPSAAFVQQPHPTAIPMHFPIFSMSGMPLPPPQFVGDPSGGLQLTGAPLTAAPGYDIPLPPPPPPTMDMPMTASGVKRSFSEVRATDSIGPPPIDEGTAEAVRQEFCATSEAFNFLWWYPEDDDFLCDEWVDT